MECVSRQTKEFRFAEIYYLLKKLDPERWQAEEVKITLEWLADMGLVRRKIVKTRLFYQSCFDYSFLLSRIKQKGSIHCAEPSVYICKGIFEKIRYKYASIKERFNRASSKLLYKSPFIIAEIDFAVPMTLEEKQILKGKIEGLDKKDKGAV